MAEPEVKYVVTEILMAAAKHCQAEILPEAVEYWFEHYTRTVKAARLKYALTWASDRRIVLSEAKRLGQEANRLAGANPVDRNHADAASKAVDCSNNPSIPKLAWKYCEKVPDGE